MKRFKRWLARKLYPEAFKDAERYHYLARQVDDLYHWCHEFSDIREACGWLRKSVSVHFMPLQEFHDAVARGNHQAVSVSRISEFRERLRRRKDAA